MSRTVSPVLPDSGVIGQGCPTTLAACVRSESIVLKGSLLPGVHLERSGRSQEPRPQIIVKLVNRDFTVRMGQQSMVVSRAGRDTTAPVMVQVLHALVLMSLVFPVTRGKIVQTKKFDSFTI